jgi:hypothetical protein
VVAASVFVEKSLKLMESVKIEVREIFVMMRAGMSWK